MFKFDLNQSEEDIRLEQVKITCQSEYSDELHDIRSILCDICETFEESGLIKFCVSGFGQDQWPVDVMTDLAIFIEKAPEALRWLKSNSLETFSIDFYEQGLERTLELNRNDSLIIITCESKTDWQPSPKSESIERAELADFFVNLLKKYIKFAKLICQEITQHKWFREWEIQVVSLSEAQF